VRPRTSLKSGFMAGTPALRCAARVAIAGFNIRPRVRVALPVARCGNFRVSSHEGGCDWSTIAIASEKGVPPVLFPPPTGGLPSPLPFAGKGTPCGRNVAFWAPPIPHVAWKTSALAPQTECAVGHGPSPPGPCLYQGRDWRSGPGQLPPNDRPSLGHGLALRFSARGCASLYRCPVGPNTDVPPGPGCFASLAGEHGLRERFTQEDPGRGSEARASHIPEARASHTPGRSRHLSWHEQRLTIAEAATWSTIAGATKREHPRSFPSSDRGASPPSSLRGEG